MAKVRMSFVANSSSSSFIIATRDWKIPTIPDQPDWINSMIKKTFSFIDDAFVVKTKEELDKQFIECYGWKKARTIEAILDDNEWVKEEYEKSLEALNAGYSIITVEVDNCNDALNDFMNSLPTKQKGSIYVIAHTGY